MQSALLFLKGQIYEALDNRGLACDCYKAALQKDIHCYDAFESLVKHQMLSAIEGDLLFDMMTYYYFLSLQIISYDYVISW